jgi:hypothetical protein
MSGPCGEATVSVNHRLENRATPTLPTAYEKDPAKIKHQKPQVLLVLSDELGVARHRIPEAEKISGGLSNELMNASQGRESFIRDMDVASSQRVSERGFNSRIELWSSKQTLAPSPPPAT